MELKRCASCANGAWCCKESALPEVCLNCNFLSDGSPSEWKPKVATNADRIRAMSDEEMADVVVCPHTGNWDLCKDDCKKCRLEWLKQPAEEGADHG